MAPIVIRRLNEGDSLEELTLMLHRAFAGLGANGLNCTCVSQNVEVTQRRVTRGDCYVAVALDRFVGTVTLNRPDRQAEVSIFRHPNVASIQQLAVEPEHQSSGIGRALLRLAESWASKWRFRTLALSTPEAARHLRDFYTRQGFQALGSTQLAGKTYRSLVLSKPVTRTKAQEQEQEQEPTSSLVWPPRHPAEAALVARG